MIKQHKIFKDAQNYWESGFSQSAQTFWPEMILFSTFIIFVASLNFQNCINFFKHPGKKFSQIFSSIGIFQVPKFFRRSEFFFNIYNLPNNFQAEQNSQNLHNFFSQISWKISVRNSPECPRFWAESKIPKFPQAAQTVLCSLENHSMWTVQHSVKLTPSYLLSTVFVWTTQGGSLLLVFQSFQSPNQERVKWNKNIPTNPWCKYSFRDLIAFRSTTEV